MALPTVVVTSRERLQLAGEYVYGVPPLGEPDGVELFRRTRAGARLGDRRAPGSELCRRLDNLPLAIELAAARTVALSPRQILDRLSRRLDLLKAGRDADPRQQTLRATIEWSYDLLDEPERATFARLAVFVGGSTLDAVEQVCGGDVDVIASLVDKSLLRRTGERFWMLETIREYALERLEESGEGDAVRSRHAEHYLALAELVYGERFDRSLEWLRRLELENENLRAALDHLQERAPSHYLQLAGALGPLWDTTSQLAEGAQRLEDALASTREDGPVTARALMYLGALDVVHGQFSVGLSRLEQAIDLWSAVGTSHNCWTPATS